MHMYISNLRFDVSLWFAEETICPLIQFTRGRLVDLNVTVLAGSHLLTYVLIHSRKTRGTSDSCE